jgi:uncharacterized delta-60 repeat protein
MSITRFSITQTPSNTATNTPTNTASNTECPTTPTTTPTPSTTPICLQGTGLTAGSVVKLVSSGSTVYIGAFGATQYNGTPISNFFSINQNGSLSLSAASVNSQVGEILLQTDGKIMIGGDFTSVSGVSRNNIARMNANGTLDTTFVVGTGFGGPAITIQSINKNSSGDYFVGGQFTSYSGVARNNIIKLKSNGSVDNTFSVGAGTSSLVQSILVQPDDKVIVTGWFVSYSSTTANRIVRLNTNGTIDNTFNSGTGFNNDVWHSITQPDGKIVCVGSFSSYNGTPVDRMVRLNSGGTIDTSFTSLGFNDLITDVAIDVDGNYIVAGRFTTYNGITQNRIVKLNPDGTLFAGWNSGSGLSPIGQRALATFPDKKIMVGGAFNQIYNGYIASELFLLDEYGTFINCNVIPITPTRTPTQTQTPEITPEATLTPTATSTNTPSQTATLTQTQTPSATIGSTATQTPSQTATLTPTTTPTLTVCPETNNCMAFTITGATEEFFPSIEYNNCYGTLIAEAFTTNGTRYRCVQFVMGVPQIFSYTGMEEPTIYGGNCNSFDCPGGVVPLTPTPTPTITQTQTPSNTTTQTNTPSLTPTNTPSMTGFTAPCVCLEITAYNTDPEGPAGSIEYNNCFGVLVGEIFLTTGTRYRCVDYTGGVIQVFSSTNVDYSIASGYNCSSGTCPTSTVIPLATPTPTPTITQTQTSTPSATIGATPSNTQTQTNTPTNTQTNTPTPSITSTNLTANLDITNGSLDIQITSVYVNGVLTSVTGGSLPNTTGNGTNLSTTQVGVYTVDVNYSCSVAGQKITLTDSDLFSTCQDTNTGSNTMTFTSVKVATYHNVIIDATDGVCLP